MAPQKHFLNSNPAMKFSHPWVRRLKQFIIVYPKGLALNNISYLMYVIN
jgi:hypothetical protein